jgi:hypothetical protein
MIDDQELIDFYPPEYDLRRRDPTPVLRVFIGPQRTMNYVFAVSSELPDSWDLAEEAEKDGKIKIGRGNLATFKAVMNFQHLEFDQLMAQQAYNPGSQVTVSPQQPASGPNPTP